MFDPLIFITVRDRVRDLRHLVAWLEQAGHQRIVLVDNDSAWEPCVEYLKATPHEVVCLGANAGARAVWEAGLAPASEWFVVTDPDVVPTEGCPLDLVSHLHSVLRRHGTFSKAGPGLYLADVPAAMPSLQWERSLVSSDRQLESGVYGSLIDTTFALHRPGTPFMYEAIRTGAPYEVRHGSWYVTAPDAEDRFYLDRAMPGPLGSSWAGT